MPLTDSLAIEFSSGAHYETTQPEQSHVIQTFADLLPAVGWTVGNLSASAVLIYALGFPYVTPPLIPPSTLRPVACSAFPWLRFQGKRFQFYNPYSETPVDTSCVWVPWGTDPLGSAAELAGSISANTTFQAQELINAHGDIEIDITADVPGPFLNGVPFEADGRWSASSGVTAGGGFSFTSQAPSSYKVNITSGGQFFGGFGFEMAIFFEFHLQAYPPFTFTLNTSRSNTGAVIPIGGSGYIIDKYTIVANGWSFAIFDDGEDTGGSLVRTSLFACAPFIPSEEGFDPSIYTVFVVPPSYLRTHLQWAGATVCLNFAPQSYVADAYPRVMSIHSPGATPLTTPSGAPLVTTAWIMYGKASGDPIGIIGRLRDCAVVTDFTGGQDIGGKTFFRLSRQDGTGGQSRATLLMAATPKDRDPTTGGGPTVGPNFQHVNVRTNYIGPPTLEWVDGPTWDSSYLGRHFEISANGHCDSITPFTITSVLNGTHMTFSPAFDYYVAPGDNVLYQDIFWCP